MRTHRRAESSGVRRGRARDAGASRRGWSLAEALVVMVTGALFISLAAGALTQARRDGRLQVCLGNLNQIGQAMQQYFAEFDDQFPWFATVEYREDKRTTQSWFYGGRYPPIDVGQNVPPDLRFLPEERPFNAYLYPGVSGKEADLPIYRCPSEDGTRWVSGGGEPVTHDPRLAYLTTGSSYTGNWWWPILSALQGSALGKRPDYGRKLVRYKLNVEGAGEFMVVYGDPLDTMIAQQFRYTGWHGDPGYSETLFVDGHAAYLLTDTERRPWYQKPEWTLWFNVTPTPLYVPAQFLPPYPGIEVYEPP
jgi:type II secretory pathway pseudopilin PulG